MSKYKDIVSGIAVEATSLTPQEKQYGPDYADLAFIAQNNPLDYLDNGVLKALGDEFVPPEVFYEKMADLLSQKTTHAVTAEQLAAHIKSMRSGNPNWFAERMTQTGTAQKYISMVPPAGGASDRNTELLLMIPTTQPGGVQNKKSYVSQIAQSFVERAKLGNIKGSSK